MSSNDPIMHKPLDPTESELPHVAKADICEYYGLISLRFNAVPDNEDVARQVGFAMFRDRLRPFDSYLQADEVLFPPSSVNGVDEFSEVVGFPEMKGVVAPVPGDLVLVNNRLGTFEDGVEVVEELMIYVIGHKPGDEGKRQWYRYQDAPPELQVSLGKVRRVWGYGV